MIRRVMLILSLGFMSLSPAFAQGETEAPDAFGTPVFEAFQHGTLMQRLRREAAQQSMTLHQPTCFETPELELLETYPVSEISFVEGAVAPTQGIWRERVFNRSCEETATENFVFAFTSEGQQSFVLPRGRTRAGLDTQLSLVSIAVEMAMQTDAAEGCDVGRIADTYVSEEMNSERWQERWEVTACGERIDLDITFNSATANGTTYEIDVVD